MNHIIVIGLNRQTAPIQLRQVGLFAGLTTRQFSERLSALSSVKEHVFLSTGNRAEIFLITPDAERAFHEVASIFADVHGIAPEELKKYLFLKENKEGLAMCFGYAPVWIPW